MTRRKKIELINGLINQLNNLRKEEGKTFVVQCKSVIKSTFGIDSPEYEFFTSFEIDLTAMGAGEPYAENHFQREKQKLLNHLNNCVQTINNVPQSKENWLSKIDNWKIILAFISLAITVFTGGYQYKQHERNNDIFDLKKENQKLHEANESLTITLRKLTAQPAKQNITRHEK